MLKAKRSPPEGKTNPTIHIRLHLVLFCFKMLDIASHSKPVFKSTKSPANYKAQNTSCTKHGCNATFAQKETMVPSFYSQILQCKYPSL